MIRWPHTYYINVWFGGLTSENTACLYRTNNLEDFISHVEDEIRKNHLNSNNSRTIVRGDTTFFSFYRDNGEKTWREIKYMSEPDKTYNSFDIYKAQARRHERQVSKSCQDSQPQLICSM